MSDDLIKKTSKYLHMTGNITIKTKALNHFRLVICKKHFLLLKYDSNV